MHDSTQGPKIKLPEKGMAHGDVLEKLAELREGDARWEQGRTFSLVYHAGQEHTELLKRAHGLYFSENALNPGAFKSLKRLEMEVVSIAGDLLGGGPETAGTMSSGGSESILLALKTYRDRARALSPAGSPQSARPEVILPVTAHPAFLKAAHCLDVRPVLAPTDASFRVDVDAVRRAITPSTILLVGSAPAYPHGVIDPIEDLASLAAERGLGMHVDACLGGFLLPFLRRLGRPIPPFDLRVPGVTSISADLHKYGFAAKGASTILYRDKELRKHQFFVYADWPGGLFGSTTMAGTRPGGSIAAAWAALHALGEEGYLRIAKIILDTTKAMQEGIEAIPGLRVVGEPDMSVFAFTSDEVDMFAVADAMEAKGWHVDRQGGPPAIHLMITPAHEPIVGAYVADLRAAVDRVRGRPEASTEGSAAMYGMLAKIPDRGAVNGMVLQFIDDLYSP